MKVVGNELIININGKKITPPTKKIGNVIIFDEKNIPINEPYEIIVDGVKIKNNKAIKIKKSNKFSVPSDYTYYRVKQNRQLSNNRHDISSYIVYTMHVKGFTNSKTCRVKNKGKFLAAKNNLSYIKDLGFNAIELMPVYYTNPSSDVESLVNYWGYTRDAYYYAPHPFFGVEDGIAEFRDFVKECHKNEIDVILQFYFNGTRLEEIEEILAYWIFNFGIDGFHLIGNFDKDIVLSPYLTDINLFIDNGNDSMLNASYNDEALINIRKMMQGDNFAIKYAVNHIVENQKRVNYVANVDGFTLRDVFTYVMKHNEINKENNQDGRVFNFSQNQGFEGETEDNFINQIRRKMVKNALTLLFLSSGVPLVNMGDECYTTHYGNNNMYGIDDELNYLHYNKDNDIIETVKALTKLRKALNINYNSDKSYSTHGIEAWSDPLENYNGSIGIYQSKNVEYFIAINMADEDKTLGVPDEAQGLELVFTTSENESEIDSKHVTVHERSISIFARKDKLCLENM